ncbi:head GIN domain-containing protein [Novosphingobium lentum]|uniref:head GIN domain-containing protein n=1 Tax=Novosphingobium lentum TaxID=145287 RepID=UPI000A96B236|nr:head GIN domain-containing protein [Novosphingobium lentum]
MFKDLARAVAGIAVMGLAVATSGCDNVNFDMDGHKGVPLAELDLSGKAPGEVTLLGPDHLQITRGDTLAITVDGDQAAKDHLRFVLDDGKLGIGRDGWKNGTGIATIHVTMPAPSRLVMAGSGTITADALAGAETRVTIAGSGTVDAPSIETDELKVDVAGSGRLRAGGHAKTLKVTMAGSGAAELIGLTVGSAKVDVAGSGNTSFASDGDVSANIMGSGEVRVRGRAKCTVQSMGSGKLVCEPG